MELRRTVAVGSRGSALALRQTELVLEKLRRASPERELRVVTIRTRGDVFQQSSITRLGKGVFIKEIEDALLERRIDIAVHSLKDMPTDMPAGLTIGAVMAREDPRDALVSRKGETLAGLPAGSRVGTSSPRRVALVKALRPDLEVVSIRGNVDTRLRKVAEGEYDAVVVAVAGLARLGLTDRVVEVFSPEEFVPAVGQGALAVEMREWDEEVEGMVYRVNDPTTRTAVTAERAFLRALGGGCLVPAAAYGELKGGGLHLAGMVAAPDGSRIFRERVVGSSFSPEETGEMLAQRLLEAGASRILVREV